ncbi:ABC transporter permease [Proteiniclasticum ruminis]|uniref:ABC-2 type transport system permease protein n=1 Tax=Proteiniclasticum ruminis TaxID=398199 RepID=A0A1G8PD74_9CLOT|nr:ABC transporter permease [Proteiniclasticum ruminis]SDI90444.1 ABC-2 type transport system permease protein [Proteiniclasticum ruminis]
MKNLLTVFQFEFRGLLKKKSFVITTLIVCLLALIGTSLPTIMKAFEGEDAPIEEPGEDLGTLGIVIENSALEEDVLKEKLAGFTLEFFPSRDALQEKVLDGTMDSGYIVTSPSSYTAVVKNISMFTGGDFLFDEVLRSYNEDLALEKEGYNPSEIKEILQGISIERAEEVLGKDSQNNYYVVYALIIVLFMIVMFYGNNVATLVAREKSDRTMEILVTSTHPNSLIIGKVLASGLAGILQAGLIALSLFGGYLLNRGNYSPEIQEFLKLSIDPKLLLVFLFFGTTGYFLLLFLYASIGALVSKVEDVPSATTLVTMFSMAAYFISLFTLNFPESLVLKVASYVPFTSFMAMFVRYAINSISFLELALSYGILLATTAAIALLSVKIYRYGTLNYGNSGNTIKLIRTALKESKEA